ncbi:hypothetical protein GQX74_004395 [Glossina fuscipes]|nr:hypothetical protein GQX74_004395 [Glossina fuscipes]
MRAKVWPSRNDAMTYDTATYVQAKFRKTRLQSTCSDISHATAQISLILTDAILTNNQLSRKSSSQPIADPKSMPTALSTGNSNSSSTKVLPVKIRLRRKIRPLDIKDEDTKHQGSPLQIERDGVILNGKQEQTTQDPLNGNYTTEIANVPVEPFVTKSSNHRSPVSPAYLDEIHRQFLNPISYLGGPQLQPRNRNSIDSILSLD